MRRRSRTGGKPVKAQRRKAVTLKRREGRKTVRRRSSSAARRETEIARLTRAGRRRWSNRRRRPRSQRHQSLQFQAATRPAKRREHRDATMPRRTSCDLSAGAGDRSICRRPQHRTDYWTSRGDGDLPGKGTVVGRAALTKQVARMDDAWNDQLYEKKTGC